ncbi:MAG: hypothetical protein ACK55I_31060, partial [bacterium]
MSPPTGSEGSLGAGLAFLLQRLLVRVADALEAVGILVHRAERADLGGAGAERHLVRRAEHDVRLLLVGDGRGDA